MFMNEPDFDDEFTSSPGFEYGQAFPSPDSKQRQQEREHISNVDFIFFAYAVCCMLSAVYKTGPSTNRSNLGYEEADDNDELPSFKNGGQGTPQNSRARMLAQQRDIQMKKRMNSIQSGGKTLSTLVVIPQNRRCSCANVRSPNFTFFLISHFTRHDSFFIGYRSQQQPHETIR